MKSGLKFFALFCLVALLGMAVAAPADIPGSLKNDTSALEKEIEHILATNHQVFTVGGMVVGLFALTSGYYLLEPTLFLAGFAVGALPAYDVVLKLTAGMSYQPYLAIGAMVVVGLSVAFLTIKMLSVGLFCVGAAAGLAATYLLQPTVIDPLFHMYEGANATAPTIAVAGATVDIPSVVVGVVLMLVCGALTLYYKRSLIVAFTSLAGSFAIVQGVQTFFGKQLLEGLNNNKQHYGWASVGMTAALVILGLVIQFNYTAVIRDEAERKQKQQQGASRTERTPLSASQQNAAPMYLSNAPARYV